MNSQIAFAIRLREAGAILVAEAFLLQASHAGQARADPFDQVAPVRTLRLSGHLRQMAAARVDVSRPGAWSARYPP